MGAELSFDEATHTYRAGPRRLPSVSQIIAPLFDFDGIPARVLDRKADIGTALHAACELLERGSLDESSVDPAIEGYLIGWQNFIAAHAPSWSLIERPVADLRLGYAGRPDRAGHIGGMPVVVDIKTVHEIHPGYGVQLAAYEHLAFGMSGAGRRLLVQLMPGGTYRLHQYANRDDWRCFLGLLAVHHWKEKNPC